MAICAASSAALPWHRATIDQRMREPLGFRGRIEKRDRIDRLEPGARASGSQALRIYHYHFEAASTLADQERAIPLKKYGARCAVS